MLLCRAACAAREAGLALVTSDLGDTWAVVAGDASGAALRANATSSGLRSAKRLKTSTRLSWGKWLKAARIASSNGPGSSLARDRVRG